MSLKTHQHDGVADSKCCCSVNFFNLFLNAYFLFCLLYLMCYTNQLALPFICHDSELVLWTLPL